MRIITTSLVILVSALWANAQQPVTGHLIEQRMPLTEAAVAFDADGAPALEATLTRLNAVQSTPSAFERASTVAQLGSRCPCSSFATPNTFIPAFSASWA